MALAVSSMHLRVSHRLPVPFWAIEVWDMSNDQEPFLARTCWKYVLRIFRWARKYGLRINLDLHTAPGSQNGYNHSGKQYSFSIGEIFTFPQASLGR